MSNETKVGLLVVVALLALGWLSVQTGSFGFGVSSSPMRQLSSVFTDVEGVKAGSPVKMAGVDVGEVTSVDLQPNGNAVLHFKVKQSVALPADVTAGITTSGLIGERFVALVPGPSGAMGEGGLLPLNVSSIPATTTADPSKMGDNFAKVSSDLESMTATMKQVLGNPENAKKLQQIIDGLSSFSQNVGGDSGKMMHDMSVVAANFAEISQNLKDGKGTLGQLLAANPSGTSPLGGLGDMQGALKDLREVMAKINSGQGTLGKLVNDPETADKLNNALDTFSDVSDRVEQFRTQVAFEGSTLLGESNVGKGGAELTLQPRPTRFYVLGATADGFATKADSHDTTNPYYGQDFGHSTKFTAQFGQVFQNALLGNDVAVRVGLKNSTGGVGVDTYGKVPFTNKDVKYSADVYDFSGNDTPGSDNPHVDLTARADLIGKTVYGIVGYDNVLNQQYGSPMVGVGMKFQDDDLKYILGRAI